MNAMERMLSDDLARAIDRLATSIPEGSPERIRTVTPTLAARLADVETGLAGARAALVEDASPPPALGRVGSAMSRQFDRRLAHHAQARCR